MNDLTGPGDLAAAGSGPVAFCDRLGADLADLEVLADELLAASRIEYMGARNQSDYVVIIAPDWEFAAPTDEIRRIQMKLVPRFDRWFELFSLLFADAPPELRSKIEETHGQIREWFTRDASLWGLPSDLDRARELQHSRFTTLAGFLDILPTDSRPPLVVPDTSALVDAWVFGDYPQLVGIAQLDIALAPAVLSELDGLKDQGKHQLIRDKARAAGTAIKELRQKGRLLDGVPVTDAVTVFSRPVEPDFTRLPRHLDPTVPDDRLLGAALELQRDRPRGIVVLLTGDVNLQTKAELVDLPFVELPPSTR